MSSNSWAWEFIQQSMRAHIRPLSSIPTEVSAVSQPDIDWHIFSFV